MPSIRGLLVVALLAAALAACQTTGGPVADYHFPQGKTYGP